MLSTNCITIPKGVFITDNENGDKVIFNYNNGQYYGLDKMGAYFWNLLCEHKNIDMIIDIVMNKFEVDKHLVTNDLLTLINNLEKEGLVQLS